MNKDLCKRFNEAAIALAEELAHHAPKSPEEEALLELLVTLIEKFEGEHYPIPVSSPLEILKHLMEARKLTVPDLPGCFSCGDTIDEAIEHEVEALPPILILRHRIALKFNTKALMYIVLWVPHNISKLFQP